MWVDGYGSNNRIKCCGTGKYKTQFYFYGMDDDSSSDDCMDVPKLFLSYPILSYPNSYVRVLWMR